MALEELCRAQPILVEKVPDTRRDVPEPLGLKDLEARLRTLLSEKQPAGIADTGRALLKAAPHRAAIVNKTAIFLAGAHHADDADLLLHEVLVTAPAAVTGGALKALLRAKPDGLVAQRLSKLGIGKISPEATVIFLRHVKSRGEVLFAIELCRRALDAVPQNIDLRLELAGLLRGIHDTVGARKELQVAERNAPGDARIQRQLGRLELLLGNPQVAERHARETLRLAPADVTSRLELGQCLLHQKRYDDAIQYLQATAVEFSDTASVHAFLGHACRWSGRHSMARASLMRALEVDPENAEALTDLAKLNEEAGDCESGLGFYQRAMQARGPSFNASRYCYALLGAGRTREAFAAAMGRVEHRALATLPGVRMWRGEPLAGKSIMIIAENGVADQIRDSCTYAELTAAAGRVTVTCDPRLQSLLERSHQGIRFLPVQRERRVAEFERMLAQLIDERALSEMKEHDYCLLSPDLLYYFRSDNERWGRVNSYLVPSEGLVEHWRGRFAAFGPGLRVGVSWRSGVLNYNRECLYTRLLDWGPIFAIPGVTWVNLQYDECDAEVSEAEANFGVKIHSWADLDRKDDFDGVSALLKQLDLVLAPNTTVLEHAGALGVPARYMVRVPISYDHWRRKDASGQDRLYPSVRHIYGDRPWDTPSLISNTAAEIRHMLQAQVASR